MAELAVRLLAVLFATALLVPAAAAAKPARQMQLGYADALTNPADPTPFDIAKANGARLVRFNVRWSVVAPMRPADPTDPADPAYDWQAVDGRVREATDRGLGVVLTVTIAPAWAEGPNRPADATAGSWRPDPAALADFFTAATRHFSGRVTGVPRVRRWQVWNEPNLARYVAPQGPDGDREGPAIYRGMLVAAYKAIKRQDAGATVVTAGTAPYGDTSGLRTRPVEFWRTLLCLNDRLGKRKACPGKARFDVWAHHPYGVGGPTQHALHRDDAAIPDLGRIARVVRAAVKRRTVRPARPKPAWVTEFSWDSSPPDPDGVPSARHARWLEGALYAFWKAGVRTALWFQIVDQAPEPSFGATYQSGTNLIDGTPKPAARAYRFPFVAPATGRKALVWGLAPRAGRVTVQRRTAGGWRTLARPKAAAGRVFTARVRARTGQALRAKQAQATSLTWRVGSDG